MSEDPKEPRRAGVGHGEPWGGVYEKPMAVPDNVQPVQTVLYGPRGEPLIERRPRPVGFRPPR